MGAIIPNNRAFTADNRFLVYGSVVFGNEGQKPDPENPGTLKQIFIDQEETTPAQNPQPLDGDAKFQQGGSTGKLFGSGIYSVLVLDSNGAEQAYMPSYSVIDNQTAQDAAEAAEAAQAAAEAAAEGITVPAGSSITLAVETIADLRALEPLLDGQQVSLSGYHSTAAPEQPKGGGIFTAKYGNYSAEVSSDTLTGIYVAFPSDQSGATGAWVRNIGEQPVNVTWFGATVDGATDDTASAQAAIDWTGAAGGGEVFVPRGTMRVDMIAFGLFLKDNVTLIGCGDASVIKGIDIPGASNFVYCISIAGVVNAGVKNLTVDASRPSGETDEKQWHGIRIDGDTDNTIIDSVSIRECKGDGIWIVKNPGFASVPLNGTITNCNFDAVNRQDIALVEGDGFTIYSNNGTGVLDVEADSPSGRVNQNHIVSLNVFDKIRISPLTGLNGINNNIETYGNRCNELSIWGANRCEFRGNIVSGPIVISQSGQITINGGQCERVGQNVTNGTNILDLEINDLTVRSESELFGIELKDVVSVRIKGGSIKLTAVGAKGISHANNSAQTDSVVKIEGVDIDTESHCIEISSAALAGATHIINRNTLRSTNGRSISKDGATSAGDVEFRYNEVHSQPVIRNSENLKITNNSYYNISAINTDFNNANEIIIDGERFFGSVPTWALTSNTVSGSVVVRDTAGSDVTIGGLKLNFTGTTATDVLLDNIISSSDTPYTGLTAPIRTGSLLRLTGNGAKYGRWYNGTTWSDIN